MHTLANITTTSSNGSNGSSMRMRKKPSGRTLLYYRGGKNTSPE